MTMDPDAADVGRGGLGTRLPRAKPPAELADRLQRTLETRGLISPQKRRGPTWAARVGLIAAGVVLGILARGGYHEIVESRGATRVDAQPGQYVLLLYGDTPGDTGTVHAAREREYGRWASGLAGGARWVGGHELADVVEDLGTPSSAEPTASRDDRLAGYFVIEASSRERAAEVARSCPHLKYGGRVVVMTIAS